MPAAQCDTAADCCPAQVCNAQGHYCFDRYTPCTPDGSCPAQGEACKEIGVFAKGFGCTFNKCDPAGACGQGTSCFNKYCVGEPPCNGGCKNPANPVCVTATNLCSPAPKDPSCAQTCPAGKVLVLQDPTNILDDHPVIAYYENLKHADGSPLRAVKAVMGSGSGASPSFGMPVEIDGNDPPPAPPKVAQPQRDTGRWPALAIGPPGQAGGRIAIAFADLSAQQLLIYQSDALTAHAAHVLGPGDAGLIHVADDGKPRATEAWHAQSFPGVQTSVSFTPSGKIALAYQDATPGDLMFSLYDPSASPLPRSISRSTVRPTGAAGFWPHMAIVSGTAYLSSATIKAATASIPLNRLFVDAWPAP